MTPDKHADAASVILTNFEREQIHTPGLIQDFGILLAFDPLEFRIERASQNVGTHLGRSAESLLGKPLETLISAEDYAEVRNLVRQPNDGSENRTSLTLAGKDGEKNRWDAFVHRREDVCILELEKPEPGAGPTISFLHRMERFISEIQRARSLKALCNATTKEIQQVTGYEQVMVYRFDADWNGEVVAETRREGSFTPYLGHRFPASDIPSQARAVFLTNWLRMIPDVHYAPVPIVPTLHPVSGSPLDLGQSFLRSVLPVHVQYLKNMGVGASLTVALRDGEKLWGLIACHHRRPKHASSDVRAACQFIGKLVSAQLGHMVDDEDVEHKRRLEIVHSSLLGSMIRENDIVRGLVNFAPNLLDLSGAEGAATAINTNGKWTFVGTTPTLEQVESLSTWLAGRLRRTSEDVFCTNHLSELFPEAKAYCDVASGLLAAPIPRTDRSFILWFKPEVLQTVSWAGKPDKGVERMADGSVKIEPRASFESWQETVRGRSMPWKQVEIDAVLELKNAIMGIDLRRQFQKEKEARAVSERANREKSDVLATVSHDLKNPLYLIDLSIQAFERKHRRSEASKPEERIGTDADALLEEVKAVHAKVRSSTKHMGRLIQDLLDVAKIEGGTLTLDLRPADMGALIEEAVSRFQVLAAAKGVRLEPGVLSPGCAAKIDEDRLLQVLSNLVGNAVKFTPAGGTVTVAVRRDGGELVVSVQDTGSGIPASHLPHVFDRFWQARETSRLGTGLGLAICKGLVEAHGGRIWIESLLKHGSKVSFTVPADSTASTDVVPAQPAA